jgi:hypothetical protein
MSAEFLAEMRRFVSDSMREGRADDRFAFKGKKEQVVYDFADAFDDYPGELYDFVSAVCGLNRETITLSERHCQVYDAHANPEPAAHKDRLGSQVSMGFSVDIPDVSTLVLYPNDHRDVNPLNSSVAYRASLRPDELPEVVLPSATEVELNDEPGDVVLFPGSSTWHLRRNAAGAVNLYTKFNDFNCDPLGEDPRTGDMHEKSVALLRQFGEPDGDLAAVPGRRFDKAEIVATRHGGNRLYQANVWGEEPFPLNDAEFSLLESVVRGESSGTPGPELERLVKLGALDLVAAPLAERIMSRAGAVAVAAAG